MKLIIHDESRKRQVQLSDKLRQRNHEVIPAYSSGDLMERVQEQNPDMLLVDVSSWLRGRVIYNYFRFPEKLSSIPVIFFNAPENFSGLYNRARNDKDRVLSKPVDIDAIVDSVE
jgi:DNA-binding response OmpR family regulator